MISIENLALKQRVAFWFATIYSYSFLSIIYFEPHKYLPDNSIYINTALSAGFALFLAGLVAIVKSFTNKEKYGRSLVLGLLVGSLIGLATNKGHILFYLIFPYLILLWPPLNRVLQSKKAGWLVEIVSNTKAIRFTCLLVTLAATNLILCLANFSRLSFGFLSVFLPLIVIPGAMALSIWLKDALKKTSMSLKTQKLKMHQLNFNLFFTSLVGCLFAFFFFPAGLGDWLTGWLLASATDANIITAFESTKVPFFADRFLPLTLVPFAHFENFSIPINFEIFVKSIAFLITTFLLTPSLVRLSSLLTSASARINSIWSKDIVRQFTQVLQMPSSCLSIKEAMPVLHNFSASLLWYLFCYSILFYIFGFMQGPVGASITNWIAFSVTDAGFKIDVWNYPQLRMFVGALIALMGAVPLAVSACAFLPAFKPKQVILNQEGIVLPSGPYFSTLLQPVREWIDVSSVSLLKKDKPRNKQTIKIQFHSGGHLKLKRNQLSQEDFEQLITSIDENAPECLIDKELIDQKLEIETKDLPEKGEFRNLDSKNFKSTIFSAIPVGEDIGYKGIRVVRHLSTKQLSAVYLVRLSSGELRVLKQFFVPENCLSTEKMKSLFKRECELLRKLDHEKIAKVHDSFDLNESSFLLIDFAQGEDLTKEIENIGPLSEQKVVSIAIQLSKILSYLHDLEPQILHRDITPDNIVMGANGQIQLIDFGAAHQFLEGITGTLIGKQCYVAPEQLRGKPNAKSDIYSFGCTLHFLLTGVEPKALSQSDPAQTVKVSKGLRDLILECTEFEQESRPKSFSGILKRLNGLCDQGNELDSQIISIAKEDSMQINTIDISEKEAVIDG